jgi:hypothetical protein
VGTSAEVGVVRSAYQGDVVIMHPWRTEERLAVDLVDDPTVISMVFWLDDLKRLADVGPLSGRVLVEVLTSMRRHGIAVDDLDRVAPLLSGLRFEGWTIHLPLRADGRYAEAERLARAALAVAPAPLWLSHLPSEEAVALARQLGGASGDPAPVRLRLGTRLWLGAETTRQSLATVLDVHRVRRGERAGYRQRLVPADGWILVIAGGTSHGIGMEAPTAATSVRQRAIALATGSLEAAGLALSPYTVAGKKRWFLEPPHMQSSLVFLPRNQTPPAIGDQVPVELRLTTATVDEVLFD